MNKISNNRAYNLIKEYRNLSKPTNAPKGSFYEKHIVVDRNNKFSLVEILNNKTENGLLFKNNCLFDNDSIFDKNRVIAKVIFEDNEMYRLNDYSLKKASEIMCDRINETIK